MYDTYMSTPGNTANIYIYIIYIYMHILSIIRGGCAITASFQRTICSCMIFQPSCFILYFIFSINWVVFYEIFYNDVTHFLTDSNENCTAYVKLNSKVFLFVERFWFSKYLLGKLGFITKIPSIVQLPYTSPPSPLGRPLVWVLLGTHLSQTWGYFFSTKNKNKKIIVLTKNGENQGRYLSPPPPSSFGLPFGPPFGGGP